MIDVNSMLGPAEQAYETGIKESLNNISEQILPSAQEVKLAAQELIEEAQRLSIKNNTVASQIQSLNTESEITILNYSKKIVQSKEDFKRLMIKVLNFQNIVNAFLGQKIQMVFVWVGSKGKVQLYALENSIDDLKLDKAAEKRGGGITGRFTSGIARRMGEIMELENSEYDKSSLDDTFKEVWMRFKISKNKLKLGGAALILWFLDGQWDGEWISGAGPLGEAYLNFFLNEYVFSGSIEPNVKDFILNEKYGAVNADNASGFLQGDVSKNNIEYGVKMQGAQSLGYTDIIQYAQEVLATTDVEGYLKSLKNKLNEEKSSNMVRPLAEKIKDEWEPNLDSIKKTISQRMNYNLTL